MNILASIVADIFMAIYMTSFGFFETFNHNTTLLNFILIFTVSLMSRLTYAIVCKENFAVVPNSFAPIIFLCIVSICSIGFIYNFFRFQRIIAPIFFYFFTCIIFITHNVTNAFHKLIPIWFICTILLLIEYCLYK